MLNSDVRIKPTTPATQEQMDDILNHWNTKEIVVHKPYPKMFDRKLARTLEIYSAKEIKCAIDNYAEVLESDHWFNYKWSLTSFLQTILPDKGIGKFTEEGEIWASYQDWKNKQKPQKPQKQQLNLVRVETSEDTYTKVLDKLRKMPYEYYLLTEHWRHFATEALKWANHSCQLCQNKERILHVHHKTYDNKGRETFNDVIVLCDNCHQMVHGVVI